MSELLQYTMFQDVLFPADEDQSSASDTPPQLLLQKLIRHKPQLEQRISETTLVVFDFETTGLDSRDDRIIEIGAQKLVGLKPVEEFSTLISVDIPLTETITTLTGLTEEMLDGQPPIKQVLPKFLDFIAGSILVAHNADFDLSFLAAEAARQGYQLQLPCFCTLKLARKILPDLDSKNLDTLAEHYNLSFESRHRSIGDVKVTSAVLAQLLRSNELPLDTWSDLEPFAITQKD